MAQFVPLQEDSVCPGRTVESTHSHLKYGVPQGSVLGPVLYTMLPIGTIIRDTGTSNHFYEDDTQLYKHSRVSDVVNMTSRMTTTIKNASERMKTTKLKLNDDNTEMILVGTKTRLLQQPLTSVDVGSSTIHFSNTVKNLGTFLDSELLFSSHLDSMCKSLYYQL